MAGVEIVATRPVSDADPSHRPRDEAWRPVAEPWIYLEKLAIQWLAARGLPMRADLTYRLDRLPEGYVLFERPRPSNPKLVDRHLYGSPRHKFYDSPNRFWPHFSNLMTTGSGEGCACTICAGPSATQRLPVRPTSDKPGRLPKPVISARPRTWLASERVPDTLRNLMSKLESSGRLDEEFAEPHSIDWLADRRLVPKLLSKLTEQPAFVPRRGEVVLFVRQLDDGTEICREDSSDQFKVFDSKRNTFIGFPSWEAGIIAQEPTEFVQVQDLLEESKKSSTVTYSGFRVEPLPKPGSLDKSLSKRYKYVPLHHIRPFVFWGELLNGVPNQNWHPSIDHALRSMASWNMIENFRFKGKWPHASIFCKGLYVGSEALVIGDAIRLLPQRDSTPSGIVTDVLSITNIQLELDAAEPAADPLDEMADQSAMPLQTSMYLYGKRFTTVPSLACKETPHPLPKSELAKLPKGMGGYTWYRRDSLKKSCRINLQQILGRCYEAESMILWFPPRADTEDRTLRELSSSLSHGVADVKRSRQHARAHDARIPVGQQFFWGNSRGECLDIHELNGVAISVHDPDRDSDKLDEWAGVAKTLLHAASIGKGLPKLLTPASIHSPKLAGDTGNSAAVKDGAQQRMSSSSRALALLRPLPQIYGGIDDEDEDDMPARFGISRSSSRKRSASATETSEEDVTHHQTTGDEFGKGIKDVAMSENRFGDVTSKRARIGG